MGRSLTAKIDEKENPERLDNELGNREDKNKKEERDEKKKER